MPLGKDVEGRHHPSQAHLEVAPHPMHHMLEMIHQRQHREHGLDHHPRVPRPARTQFEILRITFLGMKAHVGADNHFCFKLLDERLKDGVSNIRRVTPPVNHKSQFIEQQAEFTADDESDDSRVLCARSGVECAPREWDESTRCRKHQ
jgi:hypothetical protein